MPTALIYLTPAQTVAVSTRFRRWNIGVTQGAPSLFELKLDIWGPPRNRPGEAFEDENVVTDQQQELSKFIHRCVGTMLDLDAHQHEGGAVLLAYPDGSVRGHHDRR